MGRRTERRLLRRVAVGAALAVVVLLAASLALAFYGGWRLADAERRFTAVLGPPELARFELPEPPEPDNAATWLAAGASAIVLAEDEGELLRRLASDRSGWSPDELAAGERLAASNGPAFELLRRSLACPRSSFGIDYPAGADAELPELVELLSAGRLVWLDARLALAAGDAERLAGDLALLSRLTEALAAESMLIGSLIVTALDRYGFDLVHQAVTAPGADAATLGAAERYLAGRGDRLELARRALAAEGAMMATAPLWALTAGQPSGLGQRLAARAALPAERLLRAGALDGYARFGELLERPHAELLAAASGQDGITQGSLLFGLVGPNLLDWHGKLQLGETLALLAERSLALRWRRTPTHDPAAPLLSGTASREPYAGGPVVVEEAADGALVVSAPAARELWLERNQHQPFPGEPPLVWRLAAQLGP